MNLSNIEISTPSEAAIAALLTSDDKNRLPEILSRSASRLWGLLRGGRNANANVSDAVKLAEDLEVLAVAIQRQSPVAQRCLSEPKERPDVLNSGELPRILSAASSDVRYLKKLTAGGIGMTYNLVEPLRVLRELRVKLAAVQVGWPELQIEAPFRLTLIAEDGKRHRRSSAEKVLDEMIASGEVCFDRPERSADLAFASVVATAQRRKRKTG